MFIENFRMEIVFDTYAWVEYFCGTEKGKVVEKYLLQHEIITPSIVLVELSYKAVKGSWNFRELLEFIKARSLIADMNEEIIIQSGLVYANMRKKQSHFSLVDAIILTTALIKNAIILTGDKDFVGLDNVIFLK